MAKIQKPHRELVSRPLIPSGSHPIETGKYLLGTDEINKMANMVTQWIQNRAPGGIIYGKPRMGKTRAIKYLMNVLPSEFGVKTPVFLINCRQYKQPSEPVFFTDILKDVGHGIIHSGNNAIKRERLHKFFLERAELHGQWRIIVFFDDAQRLYEMHYGWLMDIYNELDRSGLTMTAILVGQEELVHQRSAFIGAKKSQIVGRFMVHEYKFSGVKCIKDLQTILSCYDNNSEYPLGSEWSFTHYYLPDAFRQGFRLENCSEVLFSAFSEARQEHGLIGRFEIPMQYLTLAVEYALRRFGVNGYDVGELMYAHWKEAILNSGYIEAELYQFVV